MNGDEMNDDEMRVTLTSLSILAHMGFECICEGEDITDDLKKVCKVDLE